MKIDEYDLPDYFYTADELFYKIIDEYNSTANETRLTVLFDLFIEEIKNNCDIDTDLLNCFDATILNYDSFCDYYNEEIVIHN